MSSHGRKGEGRKMNSLKQVLCNGANCFTGTQLSSPKYLSKALLSEQAGLEVRFPTCEFRDLIQPTALNNFT